MTARSDAPSNTADREITTSRVFDAPRDLVWRAMTDPQQVVHWWGPRGFTTTIEVMDVRPGGEWKHVMRGPDGAEYPNHSVFQEVVPGERLVYSHGGFKKGGSAVSFESTWTFEALDARTTRVTVRMVFATAEERDRVAREFGAIQGLSQTLSRLRERLARAEAGPGEVFVIAREFDAPRELVFRAWTDPEMLAQWWGPKGCHSKPRTFDLRPEGICHYSMQLPDGGQMFGKWLFREIEPPERLVLVNSFADEKGNIVRHPFVANWPLELLTTITFAGQNGKTTVTVHWVPIHATAEERTVFMKNHESMLKGWSGTFEQFADFISKR